MKTSNPPSFVAYRNDMPMMKDKNFRTVKAKGDKISAGTAAKPQAEQNLPKHPITVAGRFSVMVSKVYEPMPGMTFMPGCAYTVDTATKEMMDKDKVLKGPANPVSG